MLLEGVEEAVVAALVRGLVPAVYVDLAGVPAALVGVTVVVVAAFLPALVLAVLWVHGRNYTCPVTLACLRADGYQALMLPSRNLISATSLFLVTALV